MSGTSDGAVISLVGDGFRRLMQRVMGQQQSASQAKGISRDSELRTSSGLREFWKQIQSPGSLQILDLGSASQANVSFITDLGHKLYTEDVLRTVMRCPAEPEKEAQWQEAFLKENLNYAEGQFDGILCWDLFDFLADPLVKPLVERLYRCLKPGGTVLSFFHTGVVGQEVALYQYCINSATMLQLTKRGSGKLHRHFNNRTIENLFHSFNSLKFYLTRDNLREVISVR